MSIQQSVKWTDMGLLELFLLVLTVGLTVFTLRDALFHKAFKNEYEKQYSIALILLVPGLGSLLYLLQKALKW